MNILNKIRNSQKSFIIFGCGPIGQRAYLILKKNKILIPACFADSYKTGKDTITGAEIISAKMIHSIYPDAYIAICVTTDKFKDEIRALLIQEGYDESDLIDYHELSEEILEICGGSLSWSDCEEGFDLSQNHDKLDIFASWLDKNDRSLIDIGAGDCYMQDVIDRNIIYLPTDYIKRRSDFIIYDFNKESFPNITADVCVLGSCIMFVNDWKYLMEQVCRAAQRKIMISFDVSKPGSDRRDLLIGRFDEYEDLISYISQHGSFSLQITNIMKKPEGVPIDSYQLLFIKN